MIFPTETVYGLGGIYNNEEAIRGIFRAKNRPGDNPLILHIYDRDQLEDLVSDISEEAKLLMDHFWPGPLTLIFNKKEEVSPLISAGLESVAVRLPSHPVAQALLKEVGLPVAAPSANPSGYPSPTREEHVLEMKGKVEGILLGGDATVGLESTVIDAREIPLKILRPGHITTDDIRSLDLECFRVEDKEKSASPGVLHRHYAPRAMVTMIKGTPEEIMALIEKEEKGVFLLTDKTWEENPRCIRFMPEGKRDYSEQHYYAMLRKLDEEGVEKIFVEVLEDTPEHEALMDRIKRSADGRLLDLGERE